MHMKSLMILLNNRFEWKINAFCVFSTTLNFSVMNNLGDKEKTPIRKLSMRKPSSGFKARQSVVSPQTVLKSRKPILNSSPETNCENQENSPPRQRRDTLSFSSSSSSLSPLCPAIVNIIEYESKPHAPHEETSTAPGSPPSGSRRTSTASLEEKARKLREQREMFEQLVNASKSSLANIAEQMGDLGSRYLTIRRSTGNMPSRRRIDVPLDLPPSPVHPADVNKSLDEIDENFSKVLQQKSVPLARPPLAPVNRHSTSSISVVKPLLVASRGCW